MIDGYLPRPLDHIRVLDMSRILAGPWAGQLFADLGADVIKVERPGQGDDTRGWGPPYLKDEDGEETSESAYFLAANRGKKSITVDLASQEGQDIVRRLAARSDILLENYKVGGLAAYGLGYQNLRIVNPQLIYCSITGFGQTGPYSGRAGYDFLIQAMGGLMSVTGEADGRPGGGPQKIGVALSDVLTGLYAVIASLAALAWREKTGKGQHVDLALLDVTVAALCNQAMNYLVEREAPVRMGNAHPNVVPYQAFKAADHHLILAIGNDGQFQRFCRVAGRPDLGEDPRFATNRGRVTNRDTLIPLLETLVAGKSRQFWLSKLEQVGVPCGPINDLEQVFSDDHIKAREVERSLSHPLAPSAPTVANPIRFSESEIAYQRPPPMLGQHTEEVLADMLGMDKRELERLKKAGVI